MAKQTQEGNAQEVIDRPGTSLAVATQGIQNHAIVAVRQGVDGFREIMEELPPGSVPSLPNMSVPPGGGRAFSIMAGDDLLASAPAMKAVIMFRAFTRTYYAQSFDETGGGPPTCWSPDRIQGYGNPGIECAKCPLSKWGQVGKGENRKRIPPPCNATALLYVLTPHTPWPVRFRLPSTSAGVFDAFSRGLITRPDNPKVWKYLVNLALEPKRTGTRQYTILKIDIDRPLTPAEITEMMGLRSLFEPAFRNEIDPSRFLAMLAARDTDSDTSEDDDGEGYEIPQGGDGIPDDDDMPEL